MKFWTFIILLAGGLAVGTYQLTLTLMPTVIMSIVEKRLADSAAGYNKIHHGIRSNSDYRNVVRSSPDMLYSRCVYDLSNGPVIFEGTALNETYWSLSFFQHNTDNFFVINDREIGGQDFRYIVIMKDDLSPVGYTEEQIIRSPSSTGIALQRVFIADEATIDIIDKQRRTLTCKNYD